MKYLLCITFTYLLASSGMSQTKKALFLGNSYTGSNNLPNLIYQLALSNGDTLIYDSNTPGGHTLNGHSSNSTSISKIYSNDWDFVVLQDQSQLPSWPQSQVAIDVYPYAQELDSMITDNDPCTETVFFMTWGRRYGDQSNCNYHPPVCTYAGMQGELRTSYLQMTIDNNAICAPVGSAFWALRNIDSTLNLYTGDNSHPNLSGSYLAACVFYATLWRKSPVGLSYTAGLQQAVADSLQQVAHNTVLDSLDTWQIGKFDLNGGFEWMQQMPTSNIVFTDTSNNANSWSWDFGDGNSSNIQNPAHTYLSPTLFNVIQLVSNGCDTISSTQLVQVSFGHNIFEHIQNINIYPNPAHNIIKFEDNSYNHLPYRIFDIMGHIVAEGNADQTIDVSNLSSGKYQIVIDDKYMASFIKQ